MTGGGLAEDLLTREQAHEKQRRRDTMEGRVLAILREAFAAPENMGANVGAVAERFNALYGPEYGKPVSVKWIGHVIRKSLRLETRKSNGVYAVPVSEKPKIEALSGRFGVSIQG
jgi:hypothetical protein